MHKNLIFYCFIAFALQLQFTFHSGPAFFMSFKFPHYHITNCHPRLTIYINLFSFLLIYFDKPVTSQFQFDCEIIFGLRAQKFLQSIGGGIKMWREGLTTLVIASN